MKKLPFTASLIGSMFLASIALTAISFLANLAIKPEGLNLDLLIQGQIIQLLTLREFWSLYPALPSISLLFLPNALILMGLLVGGVIYFLAYRRKVHPLMVSAFLLLTALFPYGIGLVALASNGKPENAGVWLAFMLVGVFYATIACALFCGFQILRKWSTPVRLKG